MSFVRFVAIFSALAFASSVGRADVTLHPIFTDNMVLQRDEPKPIWGLASPDEIVTIKYQFGKVVGSTSTTADKAGKWKVQLPKELEVGGNYTFEVLGSKSTKPIQLKNIAVGEVWICSGQSNMEWHVNSSETPDKVKAEANHPNIRLFTVNKRTSPTPLADLNDLKHFTKWVPCSPETVGAFSAVGYHFGVKLQKELGGIPIGLIDTTWGGTPAQAWTSLEALEDSSVLKYYADNSKAAAKKYAEDVKSYDPAKMKAAYEKAMEKWKADSVKAKEDGKPVPKQPTKPGDSPPPLAPGTPSVLYNAMIHPLLKFPVKGAIWYQGESNAGKADEYRTLFPAMIRDWRTRWGSEFPFMLVQLAPYKGGQSGVDYAELRDAQLLATKILPKVGMAVITDFGNENDIHPKPKQPVGERLALAAEGIAYAKPIEYSGPTFKSLKIEGDRAVVAFDHIGGGLISHGDELTGFTLAGEDKVFHPAKAMIEGDKVVLTSTKVTKPVAVRFGWVNFAKPQLNFYNKAGLPASPFRTDEFPLTTAVKGSDVKKAEKKQ